MSWFCILQHAMRREITLIICLTSGTYLLHNLCVCFVYLLQPISSEDLYVGEKKQKNGYSVILKRNKNFVYKQCKRLFNRKCHTILTINFFLFLWPLWHESFLYILFLIIYIFDVLWYVESFFSLIFLNINNNLIIKLF